MLISVETRDYCAAVVAKQSITIYQSIAASCLVDRDRFF
jgi:hypothetical protein